MSVTAKADPKQRFLTGIQAATGLEVVAPKPPEVEAFAGEGSKVVKSFDLTVKPPANLVKGAKIKLRIGAFYGPGVTYTYVVK